MSNLSGPQSHGKTGRCVKAISWTECLAQCQSGPVYRRQSEQLVDSCTPMYFRVLTASPGSETTVAYFSNWAMMASDGSCNASARNSHAIRHLLAAANCFHHHSPLHATERIEPVAACPLSFQSVIFDQPGEAPNTYERFSQFNIGLHSPPMIWSGRYLSRCSIDARDERNLPTRPDFLNAAHSPRIPAVASTCTCARSACVPSRDSNPCSW